MGWAGLSGHRLVVILGHNLSLFMPVTFGPFSHYAEPQITADRHIVFAFSLLCSIIFSLFLLSKSQFTLFSYQFLFIFKMQD